MTDARFPCADLPARVISSQERPIVWFRNMIHTLASTFKGIFLRETGCEVIPSRRNLPSSAAVSDDFGMQLSAEAHHNIRQLKPHCHTGCQESILRVKHLLLSAPNFLPAMK